jgi:hypothetical protein
VNHTPKKHDAEKDAAVIARMARRKAGVKPIDAAEALGCTPSDWRYLRAVTAAKSAKLIKREGATRGTVWFAR